MKSVQNIQQEAGSKQSKTNLLAGKENAQDKISKSFFYNTNVNCLKGLDSLINFINITLWVRSKSSTVNRKCRGEPTVTTLESGKKVVRFSLATNTFYKNSKGEKVQDTQWHTVVAWGKTAELIENYAPKGKELALTGKLKSRSYEDKDGIKRYVTEV